MRLLTLLFDKSLLKNPYGAFLSILLGALLTLAFAPFHLFPLGILVPAALLYLWHFLTPRQALESGWLFGFGFFSTSVYWVYISIHTFGKAPAVLAFLITLLFIAALSLFFAAQGWITRRFFKGKHIIWGFPIVWVVFEVIRTFFLTGFPWVLLGYSQMDSSLRNVAVFAGVYGVSFVTLCLSSLLVVIFLVKLWTPRVICILCAGFIWVSAWRVGSFSWGVRPTGRELTVSLIQGNVHQSLKWNPQQTQSILNLYLRLTNEHLKSDLVVWPEAAVPMLQEEAETFLNLVNRKAAQADTAIILGIPIEFETNFYNGVIVLGKGNGTYLKRHLVPFGEYIPLRSLLSFILKHIVIPMSDMTPGIYNQELLNVKGIPFSASICYEITYPALIASHLPDAQALVTLTDDSWFNPSIAQDQQMQMTQMRALETGRYLLAATNDGVTAIVDSKGHIVKKIKPSQEGVLTGTLYAMTGSTPWVKLLKWGRHLKSYE